MRFGAAVCAAALALSSSAVASAKEHEKNAISYEPFAILSRGLLIQYERLVSARVSLVGGAGARFAARDDFESETWTLKAEGRWWLGRDRGMTGAYLGFGSIAARTSLESRRRDRSLGAYWRVEETGRFGYRFVIFGFQEITPSLGLSVVHEFDESGRLAPITRTTAGMNLSVGWMF